MTPSLGFLTPVFSFWLTVQKFLKFMSVLLYALTDEFLLWFRSFEIVFIGTMLVSLSIIFVLWNMLTILCMRCQKLRRLRSLVEPSNVVVRDYNLKWKKRKLFTIETINVKTPKEEKKEVKRAHGDDILVKACTWKNKVAVAQRTWRRRLINAFLGPAPVRGCSERICLSTSLGEQLSARPEATAGPALPGGMLQRLHRCMETHGDWLPQVPALYQERLALLCHSTTDQGMMDRVGTWSWNCKSLNIEF